MKSAGRIRRLLRACGSVDPHVPLGRALLDHLQSGEDVGIEVFRSDGIAYTMRSSEFFSLEGRLMALDERALGECRGRVLDVGAGAGRHSLVLQERGIDVVALDISPLCAEVMRRRGVRNVRVGDAFGLEKETVGTFDTLLFLMQSVGIAGSLFGLERLLVALDPLLAPGGQLLVDSSPVQEAPAAGRGTPDGLDVRFCYDGYRGRSFSWLYLAEESLVQLAEGLGWGCAILERAPGGEYLARLDRLSE